MVPWGGWGRDQGGSQPGKRKGNKGKGKGLITWDGAQLDVGPAPVQVAVAKLLSSDWCHPGGCPAQGDGVWGHELSCHVMP